MVERIEVTVNGTAYTVEIENLDSKSIEVRVNGRPYTVQLGKVVAPPQAPHQESPEPKPQPTPPPAKVADGQGQSVTAPMPGKILSVLVQVGDQVKARDTLCTLEAMKMEMSIATPVAGTVREVHARVGENVVYGDLLFVIE